MDAEDAHPAECRIPTLADVVALCRAMNEQGAKYLLVGGWAVMQHGHLRTTGDIDLLVEDSRENQARTFRALETLPDKAILEFGDDDLRDYVVLRVADDVLVDVMTQACGIAYAEASESVVIVEIEGVPIPFATAELLLRMKQTVRDKDAADRAFLEAKLRGEDVSHWTGD